MTTVTEIIEAVCALAEKDFTKFSSWFDKYEEERWDLQLKKDQKSEPLQRLIENARVDYKSDKCTNL